MIALFSRRTFFRFTILALAVGPAITAGNSAIAAHPCAKYQGKGYCTDYIALKTGARERGNANGSQGKITKREVEAGDVAVFDFGRWGHVAYVESVNLDDKERKVSVKISEWNWGSGLDKCAVSSMFGKLSTRTVLIRNVDHFWRPSKG